MGALDDCGWTVTYHNPESDCNVTVALKDNASPPQLITEFSDTSDGSFALLTEGRRVKVAVEVPDPDNPGSMTTENKLVGSAEFTVSSTCDTFFNGAITLTITDTAMTPAVLSASEMIELTVSPPETSPGTPRAECSDERTVRVPLNQAASRAGVEFPATAADLRHLIDVPLGSADGSCVYEVAFQDPETTSSLTFDSPQRRRHG